jgi:hypothetical protein
MQSKDEENDPSVNEENDYLKRINKVPPDWFEAERHGVILYYDLCYYS